LAHPTDSAKSRELQALAVDPTLAVITNLIYSVLLVWLAIQLIRIWTAPRRPGPGARRSDRRHVMAA